MTPHDYEAPGPDRPLTVEESAAVEFRLEKLEASRVKAERKIRAAITREMVGAGDWGRSQHPPITAQWARRLAARGAVKGAYQLSSGAWLFPTTAKFERAKPGRPTQR